MKRMHHLLPVLLAVALAACSHLEPAPSATTSKAPAATEPAPPSAAVPQAPVETRPDAVNAKELEEEAQRLLSMQKSYFNVFKIDEANTGLKPRQNAIGVF